MRESHEFYMLRAFTLAEKSYHEGGCPIGAVLIDSKTGSILGEGHNQLVQEGNPIIHGEMAALRAAGRMEHRHHTALYTSLQPCWMCTGTIIQFGIPEVIIADTVHAESEETIDTLRAKGINVILMDPQISEATRSCNSLVEKFKTEAPSLWMEDWGGGANLRLRR